MVVLLFRNIFEDASVNDIKCKVRLAAHSAVYFLYVHERSYLQFNLQNYHGREFKLTFAGITLFHLYQSSITTILHEAQIQIYNFLKNGPEYKISGT
jgi:hypothetical protein